MDRPRSPRKSRRLLALAGVVAAVAAGSAGVQLFRSAPPGVDRGAVWTDTVRRGPLVREVRGPGTLAPEHVRWASALHAGRVARILVEPGAEVSEETVLLELQNPDLELQALTAKERVAAAETELLREELALTNARLAQASVVSALQAEQRDAARQLAAAERLEGSGLPALELARSRDHGAELGARLALEEERLGALVTGLSAQRRAQLAQLGTLREIATFYEHELDALHVRAGRAGILQALPLEVGQSVTQGMVLAKVAEPGHLKAVLQIPEVLARDLQVGQRASVDTRNGVVPGAVLRIDPVATRGTVTVEVSLEGPLPKGARPDLRVEGTIELERLDGVLSMARPAQGQEGGRAAIFLVRGEADAVRVPVELGRGTPDRIEVRAGLAEGDRVILSDMSRWDGIDRLRLR